MIKPARLARMASGTCGAPLRWGYTALSEIEILGSSALARLHRRPTRSVPDLTVIAKTFERPANSRRMVSTLRRVFDGRIVVADDSLSPQAFDDPQVQVVVLPFDSGVARGRNAALAEVSTEFVMSVDDDFVFTPDLDLNRVVAYLRRNPEVDMAGGLVINLPLWQAPDYAKARLFAYRGEPVLPAGTVIDGLPVLYKVPQFFVARPIAESSSVVPWPCSMPEHTTANCCSRFRPCRRWSGCEERKSRASRVACAIELRHNKGEGLVVVDIAKNVSPRTASDGDR